MTGVAWRRRLFTGLEIGHLLPAYLALGLLKHVVPLRVLARMAWRDPTDGRDRDRERVAIARVVKARKLFPLWDGDCVQKSLLLYRQLSGAGADPVLAVGFRRIAGRVEGHAWVLVDGLAVADGVAPTPEYTTTFSFGRRGGLIVG
jgi:hypothetical protein